MAKQLSPLIGALFDSVTPKKQDKKRAKSSKGEKSVTEPAQQHGELAAYKEPTPIQRVKEHARNAKVHATQDWVEGRMTNEQHENIHKRANHVLGGKKPGEYKGRSGERRIKGMY